MNSNKARRHGFSGHADARGKCEIRAFYGTYRVTTGGKDTTVHLKRAD